MWLQPWERTPLKGTTLLTRGKSVQLRGGWETSGLGPGDSYSEREIPEEECSSVPQ